MHIVYNGKYNELEDLNGSQWLIELISSSSCMFDPDLYFMLLWLLFLQMRAGVIATELTVRHRPTHR